jgi:hypothetical protein
MRLRNSFRLGYASIFLFLLISGAASYAQSKSAATSITVYQDPG